MSTPRSDRLGKYRLDERLGRGGMAEVWRATLVGAAGFERQLAVKRIRGHLAGDREFVQMFLSEARITAQLHHPNIVQILELGHEDGEYFLAMELVRGHDLGRVARWLAKKGPPDPGFAAYVVLEIARALAYAHELTDGKKPLGLMHRDVSPSNVMLGFDGSVKLLDFGIAKAGSSDVATRSGVMKGKLGYFSPEQVRGETPDQRADQFAAGVVLHELLTGKPLFRRNSDVETLALVMQAEAAAPSQVNPRVPPALDAVCLRTLAREPDQRYAGCRDLVEALSPIVHELGFSATRLAALLKELDAEAPQDSPQVSSVPCQRRRRRKPYWLWPAFLAVAAAGGALVWWTQRAAPVVASLPDLGEPRDLSVSRDLATPRDLSSPLDLSVPRPRKHPPPKPKAEPPPPPQAPPPPTGLPGPVDPFAE